MTQNESPIRKVGEARPLARRPHICSICGHPIAIGTRYERAVIVDRTGLSNQLKVLKYHLSCPAEVLP